ncbi:EmrB/QacA subfamily drug resistance transporter [Actinoplanes lutulentus]|uniref:EmrB/QacA subfamily drug resistance transporter n=1 Tax=Actinoplanes lutulentus TaxID=1287878 RepID=A0A327ZCB8_9ACTN|nr:MFS transporter [Actinoplanes lutulentus]MBB2946994.1 EmrB/QacA subfamily drug resistance transporter [Actinoplanes lutulentus]RAK30496.1 EmrB/QacA subfamily drug resistance transporter [Actinoplanes lutulentus]
MTQSIEETGSSGSAKTEGRGTGGNLLVLYLALGGLAFAVLQSLVSPALSTIGHELNASTSDVSWVVTSYLLSASVLTPILGRLGDIAGKRKVLIGVLAILAAGTVVAALAPNLAVLIVGRILQGAAGAILPLSIGMVRDELPREKVATTVGLISAIFGVGAGIGIVAAGPIVEHLSWHWLFWLPLVLVVIALIGAIFGMKESPVRTPGKLDVIGASILSVSLVALLLAISKGQSWGWGEAKAIGLLALGVVGLIVFVLVELRVKEPLIDMKLMKIRGVWATDLVALILGFAMFGTFLLVPTLLQLPEATGYGFGKSVSQAGLFLLPTVVMMVIFGPIAGILTRKYGPKLPMFLGAVFVVAAFTLPALGHGAIWQVLGSGVLTGAGIGFAFAAMSNAIIEAVPAAQTGEATSVNTIARTIGSSIGTAVVAAVITSNTTPQGLPTDAAFTNGFWVCAGVAVLAVVAALLLPAAHKRHEEAVEAGVSDLPPEPDEIHVLHRTNA